jgi:hypothetical protein
MNYKIVKGKCAHEIPFMQTAFLPLNSGDSFIPMYFGNKIFCIDIDKASGGTWGSPVVISGFIFCGFLKNKGGQISSDGKIITLHVPEDQELLVVENALETEMWSLYNKLVEMEMVEQVPVQQEWLLPEYVTWVEQKFLAYERNNFNPKLTLFQMMDTLNEDMVKDFIERIDKMDLPKGKLTIDSGWHEVIKGSAFNDGYWKVDQKRFRNMPALCDHIAKKSFVPGLWMGLPFVQNNSPILQDKPHLFYQSKNELTTEGGAQGGNRFFRENADTTDHFRGIIKTYIDMGFRKLKFDFFYGPRKHMIGIIKCINEATRSIDKTVEIESHHPDIFFSRYIDSIRLNDVLIQPATDWAGLTLARMRLTTLSCPDKIINLDHVGGNQPFVQAKDIILHSRLFDLMPDVLRYPVISILPDRYDKPVLDAVKDYLLKNTTFYLLSRV